MWRILFKIFATEGLKLSDVENYACFTFFCLVRNGSSKID